MEQFFTKAGAGRGRIQPQRGASLLEVLISLALFAIGISGALRLHAAASEAVRQNQLATQEMLRASDIAETRTAVALADFRQPAAPEPDDV